MENGNRLIFYSDQVIPANRRIDAYLAELAGKSAPSIAYIPSDPARYRAYFEDRRSYYDRIGITDIRAFPLDHDLSASEIDDLFACDIVHLSGGDTFGFLRVLQQRGMIPKIRAFAKKGVIAGTSAGAILMTPNIRINWLCETDVPGNLTDLSALALVPFEFSPHLTNGQIPALQEYSRTRPAAVIYAARDGDGIIVTGEQMTFVGDVVKIVNGDVIPTNAA
jgi:dipeptidase E